MYSNAKNAGLKANRSEHITQFVVLLLLLFSTFLFCFFFFAAVALLPSLSFSGLLSLDIFVSRVHVCAAFMHIICMYSVIACSQLKEQQQQQPQQRRQRFDSSRM